MNILNMFDVVFACHYTTEIYRGCILWIWGFELTTGCVCCMLCTQLLRADVPKVRQFASKVMLTSDIRIAPGSTLMIRDQVGDHLRMSG